MRSATYNRDYYERNKSKWHDYYVQNPGRYNEANRKQWAAVKERLFEVFGAACATCGFSDKRALQLDHKNGGGMQHRRSVGNSTYAVYKSAIDHPNDFQILCANCNWIKRFEQQEHLKRTV